MSDNDTFIAELAACNGDPAKIAIVTVNKIQGIVGNGQLAVADLVRRFDAAERDRATQATLLADALVERIRHDGALSVIVAESVRAEAATMAAALATAGEAERSAIQDHLARIDTRLAAMVPPGEIRGRLDHLEEEAAP